MVAATIDRETLAYARNWVQSRTLALAHPPSPAIRSARLAIGKLTAPLLAGQEVAAVPSEAAVGGAQGGTEAAQADAALKSVDPNNVDAVTQVFLQHPIVGATSVMDLALAHSGYQPTDPTAGGNYQAYLAYVNDVVTAPFFHLNYADQKKLHQSSDNWDNLINSIVDLFEGIVAEQKERIVTGLKQLAHTATSTSETREEMNVFSQQVLSVNSSSISVGIYYSSVAMIQRDGKHTTRQADYTVNRALLNFNVETWPQFARMVAEAKAASVSDWLSKMKSKKST